jgi:hypothetical protein
LVNGCDKRLSSNYSRRLLSLLGGKNLPALTIRNLQVLSAFALICVMTSRRIHIERLAVSILDAKGIEAIWQLQLDAAYAYRTGYPVAAEAILELAEAAERELMRRENANVHSDEYRE